MGMLDGQVALITGCGRLKGFGRAMALSFAREGAELAITDVAAEGTRNLGEHGEDEELVGWRGLESLADEIEQLGRSALRLLGDVSHKADAERMVAEALERYGRIDILVNNAGAPHGEDRNYAWEVPEGAYDQVMAVNAKGTFLMSTAVIRHMLARGGPGRIVNLASVAGKVGMTKRAVYCASKFAVVGLTQALAQELAPHGVTVNAICPGAMDTARNRASASREAASPDQHTAETMRLIGAAPVGRKGAAADIARAALFLVDPAADFVTGQSINVDGGFVMH